MASYYYPDPNKTYVPSETASQELLYGLSKCDQGVVETRYVSGVVKHTLVLGKINVGDIVYVEPQSEDASKVLIDHNSKNAFKVVDIKGSIIDLECCNGDLSLVIHNDDHAHWQIFTTIDDTNIKPTPFKTPNYKKINSEEFEEWKKKAEEHVNNNSMEIGFMEIIDNDPFPLG